MSNIILEGLCINEIPFINTYIEPKSHYPMRNHGRTHCGMLYTIEGSEAYHFADKTITTAPDTILFIPKEAKYTIDFEGENSVVIDLDFEIVGNADFRPFIIKIKKSNEIKELFQEAEKQWKRKKAGFDASCKSTFYKILSLLIRYENYRLNSEGYVKIAHAVDYLHQHYLENNFRLSSLAEMSNISQKYFEILFFQEFKMTPKEYVLSMKLSLARELLSHEKASVTEVAFVLGYADVYYFSKLFKSKVGISPSEYKNRSISWQYTK